MHCCLFVYYRIVAWSKTSRLNRCCCCCSSSSVVPRLFQHARQRHKKCSIKDDQVSLVNKVLIKDHWQVVEDQEKQKKSQVIHYIIVSCHNYRVYLSYIVLYQSRISLRKCKSFCLVRTSRFISLSCKVVLCKRHRAYWSNIVIVFGFHKSLTVPVRVNAKLHRPV